MCVCGWGTWRTALAKSRGWLRNIRRGGGDVAFVVLYVVHICREGVSLVSGLSVTQRMFINHFYPPQPSCCLCCAFNVCPVIKFRFAVNRNWAPWQTCSPRFSPPPDQRTPTPRLKLHTLAQRWPHYTQKNVIVIWSIYSGLKYRKQAIII